MTNLELPDYQALCAEQAVVQMDKTRNRDLDAYNFEYFFPGQEYHPPLSWPVTDMIRPYCNDEIVSFTGLLRGLIATGTDGPLRWTDMCGGRGVALRELALCPEFAGNVSLTNVDLFDHQEDTSTRTAKLEAKYPGIFDDRVAPRLIRADATTVTLPEPVHVITSVESIQYLYDPLRAIANWYNQLVDNGLMLVSTEVSWHQAIGYPNPGRLTTDTMPTTHLLHTLSQAAVLHAAGDALDDIKGYRPPAKPGVFRTLAIQKKPSTRLVVNIAPEQVEHRLGGYKSITYGHPRQQSPVEIVPAH